MLSRVLITTARILKSSKIYVADNEGLVRLWAELEREGYATFGRRPGLDSRSCESRYFAQPATHYSYRGRPEVSDKPVIPAI